MLEIMSRFSCVKNSHCSSFCISLVSAAAVGRESAALALGEPRLLQLGHPAVPAGIEREGLRPAGVVGPLPPSGKIKFVTAFGAISLRTWARSHPNMWGQKIAVMADEIQVGTPAAEGARSRSGRNAVCASVPTCRLKPLVRHRERDAMKTEIINALNAWRMAQNPPVEPSEAIITLLSLALAAEGHLPGPKAHQQGNRPYLLGRTELARQRFLMTLSSSNDR